MVDQVLEVCQGKSGEGIRSAEMVTLARAVYALAPNPNHEAARAGLVHLALRRLSHASRGAVSTAHNSDCLSEALKEAKAHHASCRCGISAELARVLSLCFGAYAGDHLDPAQGASIVLPHTTTRPQLRGLQPVALLGDYLFFKAAPLI